MSMLNLTEDPAARPEAPAPRRDLWTPARSLSRRRSDVLALSLYVLGALWVTAKLWMDPSNQTVGRSGRQDQVFFEWVLAHAHWSVTHLANPLFTDRLNVPDGVNMMANTSILGLAIPLAPATAIFGTQVSYALPTAVTERAYIQKFHERK